MAVLILLGLVHLLSDPQFILLHVGILHRLQLADDCAYAAECQSISISKQSDIFFEMRLRADT
jgi:hypothetical protein